jgi:hypothetical protein
VKSGMDLHEILAENDPDVWRTNRPVEGGETGAFLREIIEKAAVLKAERAAARPERRVRRAAARPKPVRRPRSKSRARPKR